jgi:hypothetical protein
VRGTEFWLWIWNRHPYFNGDAKKPLQKIQICLFLLIISICISRVAVKKKYIWTKTSKFSQIFSAISPNWRSVRISIIFRQFSSQDFFDSDNSSLLSWQCSGFHLQALGWNIVKNLNGSLFLLINSPIFNFFIPHHQNFSFKFEVKLLESREALRSINGYQLRCVPSQS